MNDELIAKFVLTPYISPRPRDESIQLNTKLKPQDTLLTLFPGFEAPYVMDINELCEMLDNLNNNIPNMMNLQCEQLNPGPQPNIHSGSVSLWMRYLADTRYHLYGLNPVPSFDDLKLEDIIFQCVDNTTPPERATWAIHKYVIEKEISQEFLTNILISEPQFWQTNPLYFSKLGYELYTHNLLQHTRFIEWLIKELKPEDITIFQNEILNTHALLRYAFQSKEAKEYIEFFKDELMLKKSQLIQFSIISQIRENSYEKYLLRFLNPKLKSRAKQICDLTRQYLDFSSSIRNLLFSYFPYFDTESFAADIKKLVHFSNKEELIENVLCVCKSVLWFNRCITAISYNIAYLIKLLLSDLNEEFPLDKFLNLLYENSENVSKFAILFAQLQEYSLINYIQFLKKISKRLLLKAKHDETAQILINLPCISKEELTITCLNRVLGKAFPEKIFAKDLDTIAHDIKGNTELILKQPFLFRYKFGMCLIELSDGDDFVEIAKTVSYFGCPNLILPLFQKTFEKDKTKVKWTMELVPIVEDIITAFAAKKLLEPLVSSICPNLQNQQIENREQMTVLLTYIFKNPASVELALFINDHYKQHKSISKYNKILNEIAKKRPPSVCRELIFEIFQNFSYLCSLQIYDAFFSVKTVKDFHTIFPVFLKDLLEFELSSVDDVYDLFLDFSESAVITRSADFFVKNLIIVFFQSNEFCESERVIHIMESFLSRVLLTRVFSVSSYFETLFFFCRKVRGKGKPIQPPPKSATILIQILLEIMKNNSEYFPTEIVLTENVVKGFSQSFPPENNPFIDLLNLLRSFPPPIINDETLNAIDNETKSDHSMLAAALFSLLPAPLLSPNFIDVFDYFKENVTRCTSTFWALWLKLKYRFTPDFPVGHLQFDKESTAAYRKQLISAFSSLLFHSTPGDEKTLVFLNCWTLLCQDPDFSKIIIDSMIKSLQNMKLQLMPSNLMIMFYHSSLMVIDDKTFDTLCEEFCTYKYNEMQFEQFVKFASSVFAVYVSRNSRNSRISSNQIIIGMIADKVLEWIPPIHKSHSECLEYLIDVFNFILCFSYDENSSRDDEDGNYFQEDLHMKIRDNLENIPKDIRKFIILNMPPQIFKPAKPLLYSDFKLPDEKPASTIQSQQSFNDDQGFGNSYNNGTFISNYNGYNNSNANNGYNFDIPSDDDYQWYDRTF